MTATLTLSTRSDNPLDRYRAEREEERRRAEEAEQRAAVAARRERARLHAVHAGFVRRLLDAARLTQDGWRVGGSRSMFPQDRENDYTVWNPACPWLHFEVLFLEPGTPPSRRDWEYVFSGHVWGATADDPSLRMWLWSDQASIRREASNCWAWGAEFREEFIDGALLLDGMDRARRDVPSEIVAAKHEGLS